LRYEGKNIVIDTPTKLACGQGNGEESDSSLVVENEIDVVGGDVNYELLNIYVYPNICDAPEVYDNSDLALKIGLGVLAAVGTALVVGVFVVFGAAILASAGVIGAVSYGSVFVSSLVAGSLAGTTAVGVKAYTETQNNAISDYDSYLLEGAANSGPAALTAGIAAPLGKAVIASGYKKWIKAGLFFSIPVLDTNISYMLTNMLLGKPFNYAEMGINTVVSILFTYFGDVIPLNGPTTDENFLQQGIHGAVSDAIDNEISVGNHVRELYEGAYGNNATQAGREAYFNYLEQHNSFFNGAVPDSAYNLPGFINEFGVLSTEAGNISSSTVSPKAAEVINNALGKDKEEELDKKKKEHEESLKERGRTGAEWYVTRGAELRCSCGSHMRRLDLNEDDGHRYVTTEYVYPYVGNTQCVAGEENNIKNFGICNGCKKGEIITLIKDPDSKEKGKKNRITGVGCVPELLGDVWFDTKKDAKLSKAGELVVQKSFLACKYGGFIEIDTSGIEYMGSKDDGQIAEKK